MSEQEIQFDQVNANGKAIQRPGCVLFTAADRKKEIREQIKALQKGLAREKSSPKRPRKRK